MEFHEILVDRHGRVKKRFAPNETPEALKSEVEAALAAN